MSAPMRHTLDHPRIRGEHVQMNRAIADGSGSSPHTRGALHLMGLEGENYGIIPAYAGSTRRSSRVSEARRDHPRIRGEHAHGAGQLGLHDGIIPAYAGSTKTSTS